VDVVAGEVAEEFVIVMYPGVEREAPQRGASRQPGVEPLERERDMNNPLSSLPHSQGVAPGCGLPPLQGAGKEILTESPGSSFTLKQVALAPSARLHLLGADGDLKTLDALPFGRTIHPLG
jgi:hypothetical protein